MMVPGRCKSYRCEFCGPRQLHNLEMALLLPGPERFVTLTLVPENARQRQLQIADFVRRIRKDGYRWEMASAVEVNPAGTGHHLHALQLGDYVPQADLQDRWGGRIVHIQAMKGNAGMAAEYIIKEAAGTMRAAGYVLKAGPGRSRPVNITRGYFGGKTLAWARSEVNRLMHGTVSGSGWELVSTRDRGHGVARSWKSVFDE